MPGNADLKDCKNHLNIRGMIYLMNGISIEVVFAIFGGIILIGYIGELLSKRFSIPSALLLLVIGYLLKASGYVDTTWLGGVQGIFGTLALIVLLFDGGLSLGIREVIFKSGRVFVMSVLITLVSIAGAAAIMGFFGFDPLVGAIIGAIAGGIGSTTTISVIKGLNLPEGISRFLTLESSITDVFSIVITIVLTQSLLAGYLDIQMIGQGIVGTFSVGALIGIAGAVLFISVFPKIDKGYGYMVMLGVILALYSITEFLGGSGAIGVLIFGIMLGNEKSVRSIIHMDETEEKVPIKEFHTEVSFIVRTFFFVFLGMVVTLTSINNFTVAVSLMAFFMVARYALTYLVTRKSEYAYFKEIISVVNPRGLATAVLATYPLIAMQNYLQKNGIENSKELLASLGNLPEIAFDIIVISIIATSILVPIIWNRQTKTKNNEEKNRKDEKEKP